MLEFDLYQAPTHCPNFQIDFSKSLIEWVKVDGYALLDANLFPRPATIISSVSYNAHSRFKRAVY